MKAIFEILNCICIVSKTHISVLLSPIFIHWRHVTWMQDNCFYIALSPSSERPWLRGAERLGKPPRTSPGTSESTATDGRPRPRPFPQLISTGLSPNSIERVWMRAALATDSGACIHTCINHTQTYHWKLLPWSEAEHEAEVDVNQLAGAVQHDVSIMPAIKYDETRITRATRGFKHECGLTCPWWPASM